MVLLALFGAVMGQGVIWYTGQFYAQSFIENVCKIEFGQSRTILLWAIAFATPFFVIFGGLSDKIGRKWIMMLGMLLGILSYRTIYQFFLDRSSDKEKTEIAAQTTIQRKATLIEATGDSLIKTTTDRFFTDGAHFKQTATDTFYVAKASLGVKPVLKMEKILGQNDYWVFIFLIFFQVLLVTMVYGPIAAFLVELFPTQIRYTSMSLPYHIGNGVFGGLVPFISTLIIEYTKTPENPGGTPLAGLWYPMAVATVCLIIGSLYLTNHVDRTVRDEENAYIHP